MDLSRENNFMSLLRISGLKKFVYWKAQCLIVQIICCFVKNIQSCKQHHLQTVFGNNEEYGINY